VQHRGERKEASVRVSMISTCGPVRGRGLSAVRRLMVSLRVERHWLLAGRPEVGDRTSYVSLAGRSTSWVAVAPPLSPPLNACHFLSLLAGAEWGRMRISHAMCWSALRLQQVLKESHTQYEARPTHSTRQKPYRFLLADRT